MSDRHSDLRKDAKEQAGNSPLPIPEIADEEYYLKQEGQAGGLKVKVKVRIVSGKLARDFDARQAEALRELLTWAHRQQQRQAR